MCFAAGDQYCSTSYRFDLRQLCTLKLARCLTLVAVCIVFLHSIVFGLFFDIQPLLGCAISNPILTRYSSFFYFPFVFGLLPIVISASFSFMAFRNVRHIVRRQVPILRRRLDRQMTAIVLFRVAFFVLLTLFYAIYRIYSTTSGTSEANPLRYVIEELVQTIFYSFVSLNFASNFYIFIASSSRYGRQVKYVLVKKCWRRWKHWCHTNQNQINPVVGVSTASDIELK